MTNPFFHGLRLNRRQLIAALGAGGVATATLPMFGVEAAPLTYTITPERIADGVWVIRGAQQAITFENGGAIANITIFNTRDGAVVVDTGPSKRYGDALAAVARQLTGKDVVRAYITHFHPDHVFGNQGFDASKIAASQRVIDDLQQMGAGFSDAMYYIARDWMRGTEVIMPKHIITTSSETIGERHFDIIERSGHTPSDLVIIDRTSGVMVAGDLAFLDRAPTTPHADLAAWRASLAALRDVKATLLVPGHGPVEAGVRALDQTGAWLDAVEAQISDAFERGLSMNEAMALPLPAALSEIALARYEYARTVMHLYPHLEADRLQKVGGRTD